MHKGFLQEQTILLRLRHLFQTEQLVSWFIYVDYDGGYIF